MSKKRHVMCHGVASYGRVIRDQLPPPPSPPARARPTLANSDFGQGLVLLWPISTLASPTLANLKCLVLLWPVLLWPILGQQENSKKKKKPEKTTLKPKSEKTQGKEHN